MAQPLRASSAGAPETAADRGGEAVPPFSPMLLSFVAGYVDSYTYLALFGLFAAQVTGSFVIAGAEFVRHDYGIASKLFAILAFIVAGAAAAALIGLLQQGRRALALMLGIETALLAIFAAMLLAGQPIESDADGLGVVAGLFAAMAMGVQSVLVRLLMRGVPQTNVMTGNMTQLAIEISELAGAWRRRLRHRTAANDLALAAVRKRLSVVLSVAVGFLIGAAAGALAYAGFGARAVVLSPAIVAALALAAWLLERRGAGSPHSRRV